MLGSNRFSNRLPNNAGAFGRESWKAPWFMAFQCGLYPGFNLIDIATADAK
jgi:hypothetical protein